MDENQYHREDERLRSFDEWPLAWLSKEELARTGTFYTNVVDKVRCYFCKVEMCEWQSGDRPVSEHLRWSPNCPLLRCRTTNNVPVHAGELERLLQLNREDVRLRTFETWPLFWLSMEELAQTGMFYTNEADNVKCYFCHVGIGKWELEDQPLTEHLKWSPNCPLLLRRNTNNVPLNREALDRVLPPINYDEVGDIDILNWFDDTMPPIVPTNNCALKNPTYALECVRLCSFEKWPMSMKQKPHQLAEAGFYHTRQGDQVKCYSCGVSIKDWSENDEPWEQHALRQSQCPFLNLTKGQAFIDEVTKGKQVANAPAALMAPQAAAAQTIPEQKLCRICYANEYETVFVPCGHMMACAKCAACFTTCPMCREPLSKAMRVFFP